MTKYNRILTFILLFIFAVNAVYVPGATARNIDTLAVRSLFDHPQDESLIKIALTNEIISNSEAFFSAKNPIETSINGMPVFMELAGRPVIEGLSGNIVRCCIEDREYIAYIDKKEAAEGEGFLFDIHVYQEDEMEVYLKHQAKKDVFLRDIDEKNRIALSYSGEPMINVVNFFKELTENSDHSEIEESIASEVEEFARGGNIYKVTGYEGVPADMIDHASNRAIHVKERRDDTELELAIIHEVLAKLGVPASINDDTSLKSLVYEEYSGWKRQDGSFCPGKIIDKIAFMSGWEIDLPARRFVDMDVQRERDYSYGREERDFSPTILGSSLEGDITSYLNVKKIDGIAEKGKVKWTRLKHGEEKTLKSTKDFLIIGGTISEEIIMTNEHRNFGKAEKEEFSCEWEAVEDFSWQERPFIPGIDGLGFVSAEGVYPHDIIVTGEGKAAVTVREDESVLLRRITDNGKVYTAELNSPGDKIEQVDVSENHDKSLVVTVLYSGGAIGVWNIPVYAGTARRNIIPVEGEFGTGRNRPFIHVNGRGDIFVVRRSSDTLSSEIWVTGNSGEVKHFILPHYFIHDTNEYLTADVDNNGNIAIAEHNGSGKEIILKRIDTDGNFFVTVIDGDIAGKGDSSGISGVRVSFDAKGDLILVNSVIGRKNTKVFRVTPEGDIFSTILKNNETVYSSVQMLTSPEGELFIATYSMNGVLTFHEIKNDNTVRSFISEDTFPLLRLEITEYNGEGVLLHGFGKTQTSFVLIGEDGTVRGVSLENKKNKNMSVKTAVSGTGRIAVINASGREEAFKGWKDRTTRVYDLPSSGEAVDLSLSEKLSDIALSDDDKKLVAYVKAHLKEPFYQWLGIYVLPYIISKKRTTDGEEILRAFTDIADVYDMKSFLRDPVLANDLIDNYRSIEVRVRYYLEMLDDILYGRKDIDPDDEIEMVLAYTLAEGARMSGEDAGTLGYDAFRERISEAKEISSLPEELEGGSFIVSEIEYKEAAINPGVIEAHSEELKTLAAEEAGIWRGDILEILSDRKSGIKPYYESDIRPFVTSFLIEHSLPGPKEIFQDENKAVLFIRGLAGRLAVLSFANKKNTALRSTLLKMVKTLILKQRLDPQEKELIRTYDTSAEPKTQYNFMTLLLYINKEEVPDIIRGLISEVSPGNNIIQPQEWDRSKGHFIERKAVKDVSREFDKVKIEHIQDINMRLVPVKQKLDVNYSSISHDCLGLNSDAVYEEDFYLYRILIDGKKKIYGYVYVAERTVDGEKIWIIPGIQPVPGLDIDFDAFLVNVLDVLEADAGKMGVKRLLIPADDMYQTNREGMKKAISRAGFEKVTLAETISFPHEKEGDHAQLKSDKFLLAREIKEKNEDDQRVEFTMRESVLASEKIHMKDLKIAPEIEDNQILIHIISSDIIPEKQQKIVKEIEQEMRKDIYREKIVILEPMESDNVVRGLSSKVEELKRMYGRDGAINVEFDVAVSDTGTVTRVNKELNLNSIAFAPEEGDFVQVEGIILALRAFRNGDIEFMREVFTLITGKELSDEEQAISDINIFVRKVLFTLPAAKGFEYETLRDLNNTLKEFLIRA